ncbi:multicopper oxidase family protein [Halorubrum sp. DTA46]|uniref:multicopper oxidase family protein n=1 Tax=Halorubrum sp. DTA46 TaxID=3402162 RepID=UPI003AAAAA1F
MSRVPDENRFSDGPRLPRRALLRSGALAVTGVAGAGCLATSTDGDTDATDADDFPEPTYGDPDREYRLTATVGEIDVGGGQTVETWLYNGRYPGPEIRAVEGDRVRVTVENGLPESTSVHWHGMALDGENAMDGVPGVTQPPIEPDEEFVYEFDVGPIGTHWYHSHSGLQLDRGLLGPLVVEEAEPHVAFDREHTVVIDDHLAGEPHVTQSGGPGHMGGGFADGPASDGTLLDGRLPADPVVLDAEPGERVRLRFINAAGSTTYRVSVAERSMQVTHTDGPAVEPVVVDAVDIGMGERYDCIVEITAEGPFAVRAQPLDGSTPAGRALLGHPSPDGEPVDGGSSDGTAGSRALRLSDLRSVTPQPGLDGSPDRTVDLTLSAGTDADGDPAWTINGQSFPDADPLPIQEGEHVRVRITNRSPVRHPMHLHGHHFTVGDAVKDTVTVPGHMGRRTLDLVADNPGRWVFHCHHLYHMETGMIRVLTYD